MQQTIQISAVIPAYNAQKYIARAIESILRQSRPADEIIVVDDGSTDDTAAVVRSYGDKVRLISQSNGGASAARNAGIRAAKGNWIAFLDADDEWLPEKLLLQTELLLKHPDLVWITGNYLQCLCDENRIAEYTPVPTCIQCLKGRDYYESYLFAVQLYEWGHIDCMLIQKKTLEELGLFSTEMPIAEDIDLWLRIAYRHPKVGFTPYPLAVHHLLEFHTLMTSPRPAFLYQNFIRRHFQLAQKEEVIEQFIPAAGAIMRRWIRGMLFEGRKEEIRGFLVQYPQCFSVCYRCFIYLLTVFPMITVCLLKIASKIVRTLKIRRRLTRRPPKVI
ncbi:MAG TPA: glycosyltransferase [Anaerohalosphaeraceae bacterium]|nr:glycosyltransferase [Anaerohalosphaeraceae bacterium]